MLELFVAEPGDLTANFLLELDVVLANEADADDVVAWNNELSVLRVDRDLFDRREARNPGPVAQTKNWRLGSFLLFGFFFGGGLPTLGRGVLSVSAFFLVVLRILLSFAFFALLPL